MNLAFVKVYPASRGYIFAVLAGVRKVASALLDRNNSSDDTQPHSIIVLNYATEYIITILKNWTKLNSLPVFFHTVYIGFHISYSFFFKALILIFLKTMLFALCQGFSYLLMVVFLSAESKWRLVIYISTYF